MTPIYYNLTYCTNSFLGIFCGFTSFNIFVLELIERTKMKRLFSVHYNDHALDIGFFLLRIAVSLAMIFYGFHKLTHFAEMAQEDFWVKDINFMGKGGAVSLALTVFAEFFCSLFIIVGFCTRISLVPLLFCMGYIVAIVDKYEIVSSGKHGHELNHAFFYFVIYFVLLLSGPGKWSVDRLISR